MFKTVTVTTNWTAIEDQALVQQFTTALANWQQEGKYTGQVEDSGAVPNETRTVTRWEWIDQATAQAYLDLVIQLFNGVQGQTITGEIIVE